MTYKQFLAIPYEILAIKELSHTEKIVLGRIASFDEYFESSESCAELIGVKGDTVSKAKRHLKELGYIEELENSGRGKKYVAHPKWKISEECEETPICTKPEPSSNSDVLKKLNIKGSVSDVKPRKKVKFEKQYANFLPALRLGREYLASRRIPVTDLKSLQKDFVAVLDTFSDDYTEDTLVRIMTQYVEYLSSDAYEYQCRMNKFCPKISTQRDLYSKFGAIRDFKNSPDRQYDPSKNLTN